MAFGLQKIIEDMIAFFPTSISLVLILCKYTSEIMAFSPISASEHIVEKY